MRRAGKSAPTCNQAITVLRKLAEEAADNGLLLPEIANGISKVKTIRQLGHKTGTWLSLEQARELINTPDATTFKGKRDRVLLGLLLECGLRREEASELDVQQIQERDGRMVLVDLTGKGGRVRTVPVPWRTAAKIADYLEAVQITHGRVLRPINKADRLENGDSITPTAIYKQVRRYAQQIGVEIRPHDLRRTFGKLARDAGAPIDQIKESLGHSNVRTTEIYLGERQNLRDAPCDRIDLDSPPAGGKK
jgi:integrase